MRSILVATAIAVVIAGLLSPLYGGAANTAFAQQNATGGNATGGNATGGNSTSGQQNSTNPLDQLGQLFGR